MFYKYHKKSSSFANESVRKLSKQLAAKKIGHSGILDPLASGLMIVATDSDTKLLQYISNKTKSYIATCFFGYYSESYDIDTKYEKVTDKLITKEELLLAIDKIKKQTSQIPPIYSAKKINGQKAYDLARQNIKVELKPQKITIHKLELLEFDFEKQSAKIQMQVSEGTYVRSILMDIAKECNSSAVMDSLIRTACGNVTLDNLKQQETEEINLTDLFDYQILEINDAQAKELSYGRSFQITKNDAIYLLSKNKQIVSVGEVKQNTYYPKKVFLERL
ncbi:tRNA pseudouridine(55) synthase TruB [Mycoplasma buteonis]|uniref:tRNA pseudouridine(55) synthase TruB n=1 Tax=Mycoplasma buteonis TaxID=171280 RepID=UPI00056AFB70|nr:tRNA pseudouridine(55) synthase TruB [Mycoplasma buteonis]